MEQKQSIKYKHNSDQFELQDNNKQCMILLMVSHKKLCRCRGTAQHVLSLVTTKVTS